MMLCQAAAAEHVQEGGKRHRRVDMGAGEAAGRVGEDRGCRGGNKRQAFHLGNLPAGVAG